MQPPAHPVTTPRDSQCPHSQPGRRGPSRSGRPDGSAASPGEMHPSSSRESPAGTLPWLPALPCPHLPAGEPRQRLRKEQPALTPSLQTAKALPALQEQTAYSQTAQEAAPASLVGEEPAALAAAPLQGTLQSHTGTALGHSDEHQTLRGHSFPTQAASLRRKEQEWQWSRWVQQLCSHSLCSPSVIQLHRLQISSGYCCNVTCWVNICILEQGMEKVLEVCFWRFFTIQPRGVFSLTSCL